MRYLFIAIFAGIVTACAHEKSPGQVVFKTDHNEVEVSLKDSPLKPGERVALYKVSEGCIWPGKTDFSDPACRSKIGEGQVTRVLNQDHYLVQTDNAVPDHQVVVVTKLTS